MRLLELTVMVYLCLYGGHTSNLPSNHLLNVYKEMCPYTDFCTSSAKLNLTTREDIPCCFPCHCDDLCWNFQDCCPDVQSTRRPGSYDTRCQSTDSKRGKRNIPNPLPSTERLMLSECPDDYGGEEVKKCQGQFDTIPEFDDVVVVSDRRYPSRLFSNKHCAKCNGVTDLKRWSTHVEICDQTMEQLPHPTLSELRHFMLNNCTLRSIPPTGYDVNFKRQCHVEICTDKEGDPDLTNACNTFDYLPMFMGWRTRLARDVVVYKNVYCNLCSNDSDMTTACAKNKGEERSLTGHGVLSLLNIVPEVGTLTAKLTGRVCAEDEAFDGFFERCRRVRCPSYQGLFHGTCISLGNFKHGIFIAINFIFLPMSQPNISIPPDVRIVSPLIEIYGSLQKHFKFEMCKSPLFALHTFVNQNTGYLGYVRAIIALETTPKCTVRGVTANVKSKSWQSLVQRVQFNVQNITFRVKMDLFRPPPEHHLQEMEHDESVFERVLVETTVVNVYKIPLPRITVEMYECPTYILSMTEYNDVIKAVLSENGPLINSSSLNATTDLVRGFYVLSMYEIGICVDAYERFTSSTSNGLSLSGFWVKYVSVSMSLLLLNSAPYTTNLQ